MQTFMEYWGITEDFSELVALLQDCSEVGFDIGDSDNELVIFLSEDPDFDLVTEIVRRRKRKIGGFMITVRKVGRPSAKGRARARRAARKGRAKRRQAIRRFWRSSRGKRLTRILSRMRRKR